MNARVLIHTCGAFIFLVVLSCESESIEVPISNIEMFVPSEIIEVGFDDTVDMVVHPENSSPIDFVWSSSEPSIAEVNSEGIVTGISPGVAVITVATKDNKFSTSDTVHVIRWTYYDMGSGLPIAIDSHDNVWCGGLALAKIVDNQPTGYPQIKNISAIAVNGANTWFGTQNSGLWKYDGSNWTNYTESNSGLAYSSINHSMALDHQGNLWFGTVSSDGRGTGATRYDGSTWSVFDSDKGLINNVVQDIAIDHQGKKWFVTRGGISSFDDSGWISYTSENTGIELTDRYFSIAIDNENNKWFGSYGGALKFDGTNWTEYPTSKDKREWSFINAIAVDHNDNLWFATEYRVAKFDGKKWINYPSVKGWVHNVRDISIDSKGNKWLGTTFGVIKLED